MKKLLTTLLMMLLVLLTAAQAEQTATDSSVFVGRWELFSLAVGGETYDQAAIAAKGAAMTIELHADGSAWGDVGGLEQESGSWTAEGSSVTVTLGGPLTFCLMDGRLVSESYSGAVFTLARAEDKAAEETADPGLTGRWEICSLRVGDTVMNKAMIQRIGSVLVIELYADGSAWGDNGFEQVNGRWSVTEERVVVYIGSPLIFRLVDGKLVSEETSGAVITLERVGDAGENMLAACTGLWYVESMTRGSLTFDRDAIMNDPTMRAMCMSIELNADGSARRDKGASWAEGSWKFVDGCVILTIGGDKMEFILTDGQLIRTYRDITWTYVRQAQE